MTLSSAILALNPRNYWKLDETTGTTFHDYGSAARTLTISGDASGMGAAGPEVGTKALRVYSATRVVSGAMSIAAWQDMTLLHVSTCEPNALSTQYGFIGLGDPASINTRGFVSRWSSNANTNVTHYNLNGAAVVSLAVPQPAAYWHAVALIAQPAATNRLISIDGSVPGAVGGPLNSPIGLTDQIWIQGDPVGRFQIAHVAWFGRVLTNAELASIGTQISPWPYGQPINVPPPGGGTATLSPTDPVVVGQNANLDAILKAVRRTYP